MTGPFVFILCDIAALLSPSNTAAAASPREDSALTVIRTGLELAREYERTPYSRRPSRPTSGSILLRGYSDHFVHPLSLYSPMFRSEQLVFLTEQFAGHVQPSSKHPAEADFEFLPEELRLQLVFRKAIQSRFAFHTHLEGNSSTNFSPSGGIVFANALWFMNYDLSLPPVGESADRWLNRFCARLYQPQAIPLNEWISRIRAESPYWRRHQLYREPLFSEPWAE